MQISKNLIYSQIDINANNYYTWFDASVGNGNSGIYNGTLFIEKYITAPNNHSFFLDSTYKLGNLIYDNQPYYNIYLKYDLHEDQLIAKLPYQSNFLFIKLIKEKVKSFEFQNLNNLFVNSSYIKKVVDKSFIGFYEIEKQLLC